MCHINVTNDNNLKDLLWLFFIIIINIIILLCKGKVTKACGLGGPSRITLLCKGKLTKACGLAGSSTSTNWTHIMCKNKPVATTLVKGP